MLGFLGLGEETGVLILEATGPIGTDQKLRWREPVRDPCYRAELMNFRNSPV